MDDDEGRATRPLGTEPLDIFEDALSVGRTRLMNTPRLMLTGGLIAGLYVTFSGIGFAIALAALGDLPYARLIAAVFYPIGFMFVLVGRSELFTENFLTPVLATWAHRVAVKRLLLLWGITLAANLVGVAAVALAWATPAFGLLPEGAKEVFIDLTHEELARAPLVAFAKGIVAGILITFMTWLVIAARDPLGRLVMMFLPTYLIVVVGAAHSVVGSFEVLVGVFLGEGTILSWLVRFLLPVALGNLAGGVVFVSALHYAKAREDTRTHRERRAKEERIRRERPAGRK